MQEATLRLKLDIDLREIHIQGVQVRKAFCKVFPDLDIFSQHDTETGNAIHRYAKVQYRSHPNRENNVYIYGVNEGADALLGAIKKIPGHLDIVKEHGSAPIKCNIIGKNFQLNERPDTGIGKLEMYRTVTPLLLIDRAERHEAYQKATPKERLELVKRWLTNNLVRVAHELKLDISGPRIEVPYLAFQEIKASKKGIDMIGLKAEFATNMLLSGFGIGHFPSHGFGVVSAVKA